MHYHLWLKPSGELFDRLAELMKDLRQRYRGPAFDPHVTLLGEMEGDDLCEKASSLASNLPVLEIHLGDPAYQEDYFHCLYFTVDNTPKMKEAHQQAQHMFGVMPRSVFHPHMSLLYGLFPSRVKQDIIDSLPHDLPQIGVADEIVLMRAESTNPQDWHSVQAYRLVEKGKGN